MRARRRVGQKKEVTFDLYRNRWGTALGEPSARGRGQRCQRDRHVWRTYNTSISDWEPLDSRELIPDQANRP